MKKIIVILSIGLASCNPFSNSPNGKYSNDLMAVEFINDKAIISVGGMEVAYADVSIEGDYVYIRTAKETARCQIIDPNTIIYCGIFELHKGHTKRKKEITDEELFNPNPPIRESTTEEEPYILPDSERCYN